MTRRAPGPKSRVFRSIAEFEQAYFPQAFRKKQEEQKRTTPGAFGSDLAAAILENLRRRLKH